MAGGGMQFVIILTLAALASSQDLYSVQLANTSDVNPDLGRVEVYFNDQWGTVCSDGWNFYSSLVVCRQLGYKWTNYQGLGMDMGAGTGPTWLKNVTCKGSEASLAECWNNGWMEHSECGVSAPPAAAWCTNEGTGASTHFFNGIDDEHAGGVYVQPYPGSERYLICDQGWEKADADVACRHAGYHSADQALSNSYFGKWPSIFENLPELRFLAVNLQCTGNESNIVECSADAWFQDECPTGHEAGARCNRYEQPEDFTIRLTNGESQYEGLLEIFINGSWGAIYENDYDKKGLRDIGIVACRELNAGYLVEWTTDPERFGSRQVPLALSVMECSGDESSLFQCEKWIHDGLEEKNQEPAIMGFVCSGPLEDGRNPVRFYNVKDPQYSAISDYLMIFHDNYWGTICKKGWTHENSVVGCRELGFKSVWYPDKTRSRRHLGLPVPGGPILVGNFSCRGDEETLDQCEHGPWYKFTDTCYHRDDVIFGCSILEPPATNPPNPPNPPDPTPTSGARQDRIYLHVAGSLFLAVAIVMFGVI